MASVGVTGSRSFRLLALTILIWQSVSKVTDAQTVFSVNPTVLILNGYQQVLVNGVSLNNLTNPAITLLSKQSGATNYEPNPPSYTCLRLFDTTLLRCDLNSTIPLPAGYQTPNTSGTELPGLQFQLQINNQSFDVSVFTAPAILQSLNRTFTVWTTRSLNILGTNLNLNGLLGASDYSVTVGALGVPNCDVESCVITGLSADVLNCTLPKTRPCADVLGNSPVIVRLGGFITTNRYITYQIPTFTENGRVLDYNPSLSVPVEVDLANNLFVGVSAESYDVKIGQGVATGITLTSNSIFFFPPASKPAPDPLHHLNGDLPQVIISVPKEGSDLRFQYQYTYKVGYINYVTTAASPPTNDPPAGNMSNSGNSSNDASTTQKPTALQSATVKMVVAPGTSSNSNKTVIAAIIGVAAALGVAMLGLLVGCLFCSGVCRGVKQRRLLEKSSRESVPTYTRSRTQTMSYPETSSNSRYPSPSQLYYLRQERFFRTPTSSQVFYME